jgi:tetratricopeptide (TPR) repeat protein
MSAAPTRRAPTAVLVASAFLLGWGAWSVLRPRPTLDQAHALAEAGQLDAANEHIRRYLREYPQSDAGHLLFAQIQIGLAELNATDSEPPDPQAAREALVHLGQVHPDDREMSASLMLSEGRAEYYLSRFDRAEACWLEALRLEPTIPVAGWSLLDLYYLQGRKDDAAQLALRLFEVEPDPHDRVQLLLELVRQDAQPPAPASIVQWFEPRVRQSPDDIRGNLALGAALVRAGKADRGLRILETMVQRHPDLAAAWEAWLTGLDEANQSGAEPPSLLVEATGRLPSALAASPRFARFQGRAAQERGDWKEAVKDYRRAALAAPHDQRVEYRLVRALRIAGEIEEAQRREHEYHARLTAAQEIRSLYAEVTAVKTLGAQPHPELYQRVADLRESMGLPEEARAWHQLVVRDDPRNPRSRAALDRLQGQGQRPVPLVGQAGDSGKPRPSTPAGASIPTDH